MQDLPVVEVGMMGIQPGKTPRDPQTADGKLLREAWERIIKAKGGPAAIVWGVEESIKTEGEEKGGDGQGRLWGWFEWPSLAAHEAFARSFGAEATQHFPLVFTPGFTKHAFLPTTLPLKSPTTQVLLFFFAADTTDDAKRALVSEFEGVQSELVKSHEGSQGLEGQAEVSRLQGVSAGWGVEHDFPIRGRRLPQATSKQAAGEQEKGAVFFVHVGWEGRNGSGMGEVSEKIGAAVEREGCVARDEFQVECEVLERGSR
ncbi:hypothetical protein SVAN01_07448 [Stagonosporopsis vannaccii]|nr:hypothetical protein SVAN01_07448 [Stagonosporopsis vannaccii]